MRFLCLLHVLDELFLLYQLVSNFKFTLFSVRKMLKCAYIICLGNRVMDSVVN